MLITPGAEYFSLMKTTAQSVPIGLIPAKGFKGPLIYQRKQALRRALLKRGKSHELN
jgi:hypothetical protein